MIKIMNMHQERPSKSYDYRVDRVSPVGNPYKMKQESDRDLVCDKYEKWFINCLSHPKEHPYFMEYLHRMLDTFLIEKKIRLFCWCDPKRCHAQTIVDYLLGKLYVPK